MYKKKGTCTKLLMCGRINDRQTAKSYTRMFFFLSIFNIVLPGLA